MTFRRFQVIAALVVFSASSVPAKPVAAPVEDVTFEQKLGSQVPLDLEFRDSSGKRVSLGDLVQDKPVLLSLVYYQCPMLCTLVLNGQVEAMKQVPFDVGTDYDAVTVSFNHEETHVLAADKKASYVADYGRAGAEESWSFLVGEEEPILKLCESVGFSFKYMEQNGEYAHKSGILLLTPEGKVSRYFPGTEYDATGLRLGMVEASKNKIGTVVDRLFLLCYHYDPAIGQYGLMINRVVNAACMATLFTVLGSLAYFFRQERQLSAASA